ncbi:Costars family protein C6orf115 homolog [Rhizoctonia solani AG-1 IB]|uniref:Costars family protein C6orf115 homolog n=1 Tax=Thanatephorus cucumeris (strain AG1-IB / isolate 7/3/14) TaxID=1108050 RepID=M5BTC2_THACB|nr:Costars family protein C6orf115 homolog [Rhizoctonia solani AG-1 IB]
MPGIDEEVELLKREIKRLGTKPADGQPGIAVVKFGKLVRDEKASNIFEALNGTLRAAKRKGVITFEGQMLLQGPHDNIDVVLLQDE